MKKLIILFMICTIVLSFIGCSVDYENAINPDEFRFGNGYFTSVKQWGSDIYRYHLIYANDTKVMYFVVIDTESVGITPLYNSDGTLQVYNGE